MAGSSNRKQPARSVRSTASRPDNYYAKPFSYRNTNLGASSNEPPAPVTPGFFPAITHFTDSISALPREVQRHFTLLKETEGKAYQPDQAIAEVVTAIQKLPEAPRGPPQERQQQFLQMWLGNSLTGSVNGSVVDGHVLPQSHPQPSADGGQSHAAAVDEHQDRRLDLYSSLRDRVREMTVVLDEKNMVLTAANETLTRQLFRLDSSYPSIENEISEDARLGSNTHWALPHMKDMRRTTGGTTSDRTRRDVTNVNHLAAAAAAVHEGEIAATRSEARREAMLAKRGRAHNFDSDFDDRAPLRKQPGATKARKAPDAAVPAINGNGSHKRRRVEKVKGPSADRSLGAALNGRLAAGRESPRETPATEAVGRKKAKPLPAPVSRKKNIPINSPSVTSSPSRATFPTVRNQSPAATNYRNAAARSRISSNASLLQDTSRKRPASAQSSRSKQLTSTNGSNKPYSTAIHAEPEAMPEDQELLPDGEEDRSGIGREDTVMGGLDGAQSVKRERTEPPDSSYAASQPLPPLSTKLPTSQSGGKTSKPATPTHNIFTEMPITGMSRSRSTRGINNNGIVATNGSPKLPASAPSPRRSHKKGASQSSIHTENIAKSAAISQEEGTTSRRPKRNESRKTHVETDAYDEEVNDAVAEDTPYCFCKKPSEGEMIGCDNENCPTEWFHMDCVGLSRAPVDEWFCSESCRKHQHAKAADA